jgi:hypothetical protein
MYTTIELDIPSELFEKLYNLSQIREMHVEDTCTEAIVDFICKREKEHGDI